VRIVSRKRGGVNGDTDWEVEIVAENIGVSVERGHTPGVLGKVVWIKGLHRFAIRKSMKTRGG
jgi:hypothetical protein